MANEEKMSQGLGFSENVSVAERHAQVFREKAEPSVREVPLPLWMLAIFFALAMWGGGYLCYYSGGFRGNVFSEMDVTYGPVTASAGAAADPVAKGKKLYLANCALCHQATGLGMPGVYPPLAESEYVNGSAHQMTQLVLHGLQGSITVKGVTFSGSMPTWKQLKDDQIANILTYVRQEWGNTGGPVTAANVAAARATTASRTQPWEIKEVLALPVEFPAAPASNPASAPVVK